MSQEKLQKPALTTNAVDLPIEILNPLNAANHYSLKSYAPTNQLSYFIDHYWVLRWRLPGEESFTCEVIPSPYINLTFMNDGPRITGVTTGKYTYQVKGHGSIMGVKFKPGGYRAFSQRSATEITDRAVAAQTIFEQADEAMNNAVLGAPNDMQAIAAIEDVLLEITPSEDANIEFINRIIDEVKRDEHMNVRSILTKHEIAERRLQELFQEYVGVGPKWVLLRYRLIKAARHALLPVNWTHVAVELGYSDQSHFTRDFKRIIGKTPTQYSATIRSVK